VSYGKKVKRSFDLILTFFLIIIFVPLIIIIWFIIFISDGRPTIYWSRRVGQNNKIFIMPKFRTMKKETPQVATHLLDGRSYLINGGSFLRKLSLDEIPQLWSILKGDMSFVGPRPALFNQDDLIKLRTEKGVHKLVPGLTGWAQINGRDELAVPVKVQFDEEYLYKRSFFLDLKIILLTFVKVILSKGVTH